DRGGVPPRIPLKHEARTTDVAGQRSQHRTGSEPRWCRRFARAVAGTSASGGDELSERGEVEGPDGLGAHTPARAQDLWAVIAADRPKSRAIDDARLDEGLDRRSP